MLRVGVVFTVVVGVVAVWSVRRTGAAINGVSLRLVQTLSNSELVSLQPFSTQQVVAVSTRDAVQLWDTRNRVLKATLPRHSKILDARFSGDGTTFITSSREKSAGLKYL